ncbi:MAG: hypothetical protein QHH06_03965 [Clostridiales bacterium]|jgi:hypothetical protein|nr:hypothetical protein [Eubacteriales bacterium]MDH7565622.1 hypothetical protein [Clostridiales bacterium]
MFEISAKQYIFKSSDEQVQNVFFKPGVGLCTRTMSTANTWSEPSVLLEDAVPGFSACLDGNDTVHIFCQMKDGSLIHIRSSENEWKASQLQKGRSLKNYCKFLNVVSMEHTVYFFYVVEEAGKNLLLFQSKSGGNLPTPSQVITSLDYSKKSPYRVLVRGNDLYVFYSRTTGSWNQIGYQVYHEPENKWSPFYPLINNNKNEKVHLTSVLMDAQGRLHVCWQKTTPLKYELIYSRRDASSEIGKDYTVATAPSDFYNSSILSINGKIIVYWVRDKNIFYCISEDEGEKWSISKKYTSYSDALLYCIQYFQNSIDSGTELFTNELPGILAYGYKLGFIDDDSLERKERDRNMNDSQALIINTLKILTANVDDQKKLTDKLKHEMDEIEQRQRHSESELNKYIAKLDLIYPDITNIKTALNDIKNMLDRLKISEAKEQAEKVTVEELKEPDSSPDASNEVNANSPSDETESKKNYSRKTAMIPGTGFAHITPEYLRSMGKK